VPSRERSGAERAASVRSVGSSQAMPALFFDPAPATQPAAGEVAVVASWLRLAALDCRQCDDRLVADTSCAVVAVAAAAAAAAAAAVVADRSPDEAPESSAAFLSSDLSGSGAVRWGSGASPPANKFNSANKQNESSRY